MTDRQLMQRAMDALAGLLTATPWADHPQEAYSAERVYKALWARLTQPGQPVDFYGQAFELVQRQQKQIDEMEAILTRQTARIVDLQTQIENLEGKDR